MTVFTQIENKNPKICMEPKKTLNSQFIPEEKKNKVRDITFPDFKL